MTETMMRQEIENYEIAFGDDQGEGLLSFDLDDVKQMPSSAADDGTLEDPSALRLYADRVEVDFGSDFGLTFIKLPAELHARLRPLKGIWVAGLRSESIEVAEEVNIEICEG